MQVVDFKSFCQEIGFNYEDTYLASIFTSADNDRDGLLNYHEFGAIFDKLTAPTLLLFLSEKHPAQISSLKQSFVQWATFGDRENKKPYKMGSSHWIKLCKDCGIVSKKLTPVDADLIFAKVKSKGQQRIHFGQFLDALQLVSIKLQTDDGIMSVIQKILDCKGPSIMNGTVLDVDQLKNAYAVRPLCSDNIKHGIFNTKRSDLTISKSLTGLTDADTGYRSRRRSTSSLDTSEQLRREFTIPAFRH